MTPGANAYYSFNFPPTKFVVGTDKNSRKRQAMKIVEECAEMFSAIEQGATIAAIEECYDTIVACETLLRSFSRDQRDEAYGRLLRKNGTRGYWVDFDYDFWASVLAGQRPAEKGSETQKD